jgi:hypothetical protein
MVPGEIGAVNVHELNDQIDPPAGSIGLTFGQNVLLAEDWDIVFNEKTRRIFPVRNNGAPDDDPLPGF